MPAKNTFGWFGRVRKERCPDLNSWKTDENDFHIEDHSDYARPSIGRLSSRGDSLFEFLRGLEVARGKERERERKEEDKGNDKVEGEVVGEVKDDVVELEELDV